MQTLTAADFEGDRLVREPRTALVVFVADWCGFSRRFVRESAPKASELPVPFVAADVSDEDDPLWDDLRVQIVPTVVLFKEGVAVWRKDGRSGVGLPRDVLAEARLAAESALGTGP